MVDFACSNVLLSTDAEAYIHDIQALTERYENLARNLVGLDVLVNAYQVIVRSNMDACVIEHAVSAYTCALSAWLSDVDVCAREEQTLRCGLEALSGDYSTKKPDSESVGKPDVRVMKSLRCGLQSLRSCLIARRDTLCCGLQLCCALMSGQTLSEQAMALALGVLQRAPSMQQELDTLQPMHAHLLDDKPASGLKRQGQRDDALAASSKVDATAQNILCRDVDATAEDVLRSGVDATAEDVLRSGVDATAEDVLRSGVDATAEDVLRSGVDATAEDVLRSGVDATAEDVLRSGVDATAEDVCKEGTEDTFACEDSLLERERIWSAARRAIACVGNREARERLMMGVSRVEGES
jgi:hypothetical protein